jgi:hypothetical protein
MNGMVGIEYVGIGGVSTSFQSDSPDTALRVLSGISGYRADVGDEIAAGLAGGWRDRHKARANGGGGGLMGANAGRSFSGGGVSTPTVTDVRTENGRTVKVTQNRYVDGSGRTIGFGPRQTRPTGTGGYRDVLEGRTPTSNDSLTAGWWNTVFGGTTYSSDGGFAGLHATPWGTN